MNKLEFPMGRAHRLASDDRPEGVSCGTAGPSLGPVRLLRRTIAGFEPRPTAELDFVLSKAFSRPLTMEKRVLELSVIARALDKGDLAQAMIATLHMRLPTLDEEQARRARRAETLVKGGFDPDEPRDARGRWSSEGGNVFPSSANSLWGQRQGGADMIPAQNVPGGNGEGERGNQRSNGFQGNPNVQIDPSLTITEVPVGEAMAQRNSRGGQSVNMPDHRVFGTGPNINTGYSGFFAPSGEVGLVMNGHGYIVSSTRGYQLNVTTNFVNGVPMTSIEPYRGY